MAIITYNANPEFDADETVYLPAPKSQAKIGGVIADKISGEQNFNRTKPASSPKENFDKISGEQNFNKTNGEAQGAQDEAAKFEQKFKRIFK